jgi:hypothetical protein
MAGSSFGKYERDRNKRAKAAAKRERRQNKSDAPEAPEEDLEPAPYADLSPQELLKRVEDIHRRFDEGTISYDDFEEQKAALLASLPVE